MFTYKKHYFLVSLLLLLIEICIALFVTQPFIRGFLGDVLVVLLLYTLLRSFIRITIKVACTIVLLFSFGIEILQLFNIAERWNITSPILITITGNTFDILDLVAYTVGVLLIAVFEYKFFKKWKQ